MSWVASLLIPCGASDASLLIAVASVVLHILISRGGKDEAQPDRRGNQGGV
jgi:hypothetical protein